MSTLEELRAAYVSAHGAVVGPRDNTKILAMIKAKEEYLYEVGIQKRLEDDLQEYWEDDTPAWVVNDIKKQLKKENQ